MEKREILQGNRADILVILPEIRYNIRTGSLTEVSFKFARKERTRPGARRLDLRSEAFRLS